MSIETTTEVSSRDGALAPVASGERIEDLDVLRGFALFGVLVVNGMTWFRTTPARLQWTPDHWPGLWNLIIEKVQTALFDQKFITLFSFLFGVGMAINVERAEARGGRPIRFLARRRLLEFVDLLVQMPLHWTHVFVLFLLGVLVHRSGILRDPASHRPFLRKFAVCGFAFGLLLEAAIVFRPEPGSTTPWSYVMAWFFGFFFVASMGLGLSYAAALLLLLQRPRMRKWLAPIGKVGRMALTNYLMQSAINSFVFYGFGLGLYDRLSPLQCLPIFLGIYAVEVAWSGPWLARFEYGPVEWLWRSLTYGKAQRMRGRASLVGAAGGR